MNLLEMPQSDINSKNLKYSLHIPRASLATNSSSSSGASSIGRSREFSPSLLQKNRKHSNQWDDRHSQQHMGRNQMYYVHKVRKANLTATQSSSSSSSNKSNHVSWFQLLFENLA